MQKTDWDFNMIFFVFLRFQAKESVSGVSQVKSSIQRGIKTKLVEQFPPIDDYIAQIFPKKEPLVVVKWWVSIYLYQDNKNNHIYTSWNMANILSKWSEGWAGR